MANGYWEDVGTTAAYLKAHEDILDGKVEVDISGFELQARRLAGQGVVGRPVGPARTAPAFIGENCTIDEDAVIGAYTTVGANTRVAERAEVRALGGRGELLHRSGGPGGGLGPRPLLRSAPGGPLRTGFGAWGRAASSGPMPSCAAG